MSAYATHQMVNGYGGRRKEKNMAKYGRMAGVYAATQKLFVGEYHGERLDTRRRRSDDRLLGSHSRRPDYRRERLAYVAEDRAKERRQLVWQAQKALRCGEIEAEIEDLQPQPLPIPPSSCPAELIPTLPPDLWVKYDPIH